LRTASRPSCEMANALSGSWIVQNRPEGAMPPLRSWTWLFCEPEPGSKRSIHMKPKTPLCSVPSAVR
jgi:hypothetical protein